ncbi:MAG: Inner membrane protein YnbA [Thermoanaerobaculia bacterium]|nr:Inner membrane protein YnbA [Thermoanaerobaculia bacterium]
MVTATAVVLSAVVGGAMLLFPREPRVLLAMPVWLFLRMALNAIDGMMARELGMMSKKGAILNELGDVLSDTFLYLPLAALGEGNLWAGVVFTILAALTEFAGVTGQAVCGERQYQGPMGKSDRAFLVGLVTLVTAFAPALANNWRWVFWAGSLLAAVTVLNRCRAALRKANGV